MSLFWIWIVAVVVVTILVLVYIFRKPVVLEGRVIEKNIAWNKYDDSYLVVETTDRKKVTLEFYTHSVGILIQIGGESFKDKAAELDKAIALGDKISVETFSKTGLTRIVYKVLAVSKN